VTRPGPAPQRADRWISRAATATVAGLAGIAGAISYSHMRQLAAAHGDSGWHAHAFPLSVDGVEIVASLVLLADRRTGRRSGWLPWAALTTGTAASLAANIAAADAGTVSRIIAGWPALALLIAVKLLSGILGHRPAADVPAAVPSTAGVPGQRGSRDQDRPRPVPAATARGRTARMSQPSPARPASTGTGTGTARPRAATSRPRPVPAATADVAAILPAARVARDELRQHGQPLTRDALAASLRQAGHQVRNARLTPILHALRSEPATTP
jgi:hypothetical protein